MPYADKKKQSEYQNLWAKKRRDSWFKVNGPCKSCGSNKDLQVDHIDRKKKITHRVWFWSEKRRLSELKKCQVLCKLCHKEKTREENTVNGGHNINGYNNKGCRCDVCRLSARNAKRRYRAKLKSADSSVG